VTRHFYYGGNDLRMRNHKQAKPRKRRSEIQNEQTVPILPAEGFVRERTVVPLFATSRSTLWRWIKEGRFPAPHKIGPGTTAWDVADLRAHMNKIRGGAA
jgi:prophage regulatory protein